MNVVRIAILVIAVAAAGGAVLIAMNPKAPEPAKVAGPAAPAAPADEILVAAKELPIGKIVAQDDFAWQPWPKESDASFMIHKDDKAVADLVGSIVRADFYQGEPIRREQLVKGANSGFLSAVLPSGMRAVAINIDSQGSTSAGGFVLPNDRVDVVRVVKPSNAAASSSDLISETILTNIRVLAIGQNVQDKNGQTVVVGSTATLELDPVQAETIILAQRTGQLSLTLRSMLDAGNADAVHVADEKTTIIRYGVESDGASH